ncbi:MAG: nuclear transport factor 2 family protein [Bacteroidota bacterium]|nr:nuclear transport factor 2 family protein [Bacteroidota bacterium]
MSDKESIIHRFYTAFQQLDYKTMNDCYSNDVIFNDPVFGILEGDEAKAMWEMLCKRAKGFTLTFSNIQLLDEEYATCNWIAVYIFSKTVRQVVNNVKAHMRLSSGKIIEHTDQFNIRKWSRQALGLPGLLFGWTSWMQKKISKQARENLEKFMQKKAGSFEP